LRVGVDIARLTAIDETLVRRPPAFCLNPTGVQPRTSRFDPNFEVTINAPRRAPSISTAKEASMSFGQFLLYLLAVFAWFGLISIWVFAMFDMFRRRDIPGVGKAIWLVVIVLLPVIGTVVYFLARPHTDAHYMSPRTEAMTAERADTRPWLYSGPTSSAEQLRALADLADRGKITDEEFQAEKARILGQTNASPAPGAAGG
jgi:hypothetical protein